MADNQAKNIDPAVLQQAQQAGQPVSGQVSGGQEVQGTPSAQSNLPTSQEVKDRKNDAFAKNAPSNFGNGTVGRQDVPENLREAPATPQPSATQPTPTQDGASRYGGASPPAANEPGQVQTQETQSESTPSQEEQPQDGASRYGADPTSESQGQSQDKERGR